MSSASSRFSGFSADPQLAQIKLPPHSLEAEQSLIGGVLLDNQAWERIADLVSEVDFYRDDHRRIYRHITKLIDQGRPADVLGAGAQDLHLASTSTVLLSVRLVAVTCCGGAAASAWASGGGRLLPFS